MDSIHSTVRAYILSEFLPNTDPSEFTNTTPLVSGGILDSLATIRLVSYLEEQFGLVVEPHEAGVDYLDTVDQIAALVQSKKGNQKT